jgi:ABC-type glutathione transport system ATPase component
VFARLAEIGWRKVQAVFQDPVSSLNPRMTIWRDHRRADRASTACARQAAVDARVAELLKHVGLHADYAPNSIPTRCPAVSASASASRGRWRWSRSFIVCDEAVSALDVSVQSADREPSCGAAGASLG